MDAAAAGCDFCDQAGPENDRVFESAHWYVIIKSDQSYLGQAIIVARRHIPSLPDVSVVEWSDLKMVMDRYETTVTGTFGATMFNWTCLMNDAYKADSPQPHVHWHVWPRYNHPVEIDGETFTDPNFGHHYDKHARRITSPDVRATIINRLREEV